VTQEIKKLLIVDDEVEVCSMLELWFEDYDYEITLAHSGNEALSLINEGHFDCVLSDVRMPNGNGIELLDALQAKPDAPPIVMMSGFSELTEELAIQKGAETLIPKPLDLEELHKTIDQITRK